MKVNLHNHTPLCKHAVDEPREYVLEAIKSGTKFFGFSDHAPMRYDEAYRMGFDEMDAYENIVLNLRSDFSNEIEILLGYEVDFLEGFMDDRIFTRKVDYLIGSVHFLGGWGFDNPEFIGEYKNKDIDKIWEDYFYCIEKMAKCGKFDIVGHLDLIKVFKFLPKKDVRLIAKNAIKEIKKANLTVEINAAGFRKPIGEQYPSNLLLEEIVSNGITLTFGSDAHAKNQVGLNGQKCEDIAKNLGINKCACFKNRDKFLVEI
ncbi:histidinol-phosphatase [Campylobacter sp. RM16192]|uniref:histidinol-phosphatase n=1 Tax=Campylobacter sp. RM16192 TaxID=1660080 RepID=UPI001451C760|nr:histidinol-phosphatase [Campylobacter sp. RM16192]QCD52234.1 histidinol-phosphate phosphatase [Campylobacter sp. RM16192]